uniref:Uncharacterized protein n=1 Tax=Lepeophtheirus salmonis TaxID=72036 RepID=A0A0K2U7A0_LEPSM
MDVASSDIHFLDFNSLTTSNKVDNFLPKLFFFSFWTFVISMKGGNRITMALEFLLDVLS